MFASELKKEYRKTRASLIEQTSQPASPIETKKAIDTTLKMCTMNQIPIITTNIDIGFKAGVLIESAGLSRKVKAYTGFDFAKIPQTHMNKITKTTIGHIGKFNIELANELRWQYAELLSDNALVNSLTEHGVTKNIAVTLEEAGLDAKAIELIKKQTTTNKMIEILEMRGIRGGMDPNSVARELRPYISQYFSSNGQVVIDNVGKTYRVLNVNAQGEHWWADVVRTRKYVTNVQNYSNIVARTAMLKANNAGRVDTVTQSGLAEKEYRYICALTGNSCDVCIGMHGSIVDPSDVMPPVHPRCGCYLQAIWKKKTGLMNRTDEYYEKQQNIAVYKRYKFKEYNKSVPKADRLETDALMPRSDYLPLPVKTEMQRIRKEVIG
jgi:hypothetical protein